MHSRQREGASRVRDRCTAQASGAASSAPRSASADKRLRREGEVVFSCVRQVRRSLPDVLGAEDLSPARHLCLQSALRCCWNIPRLTMSSPPPPKFGHPLIHGNILRNAGADWGDIHRASPLWMPEPTIVSPNAEMVTAYGGAGATVSTGCVTPVCTPIVNVTTQSHRG